MFNWKRFWPINYKRLYARFQSTAAKESRVCYLFGSNIYCANLHTPKHHLVIEIYIFGLLLGGLGCGSNISPLSTSLKYWLLPSHRGGTTCGSRRIGCQTVQGTCNSTCYKFLSKRHLFHNFTCVSFEQPWWDQWCDLVPGETKRKMLPHWWATWWSPQLSPHPVGNLSGCTFWHLWSCKPEERGLGGVLWLWCDHLCLANLPNWYASCDQGQEVEYTLRSKTLKQPPLQKLKPNLSSIQS